MDPEIKSSIRKLFIKFLLFQAIIFVVAVLLSASFTAYFKQRLAGQLSAASRDAILSGDSRRAITDLTSSVARDFSGMSWFPSAGEDGFSLPAGTAGCSPLLCSSTQVRFYFDDERRFKAGDMVFYYPRWTPAVWGILGWLITFSLSVPVAFFERKRLIRDYSLLLELRVKESYSTLAAQVAHDIRSPLAALGAAAKGLNIPTEQRSLIDGAVVRIRGIADDLLQRYRRPGEAAERTETCALAPLIEQVVMEKRSQHKEKPWVKINFTAIDKDIKATVEPKELQRLISNLINNSVEAFENSGMVSVSLSAMGNKALILVKDNGNGIRPEILAKLGQKGETHGKSGGTGLGLYHARKKAESWGGTLQISSEPGSGTTVSVELPRETGSREQAGPIILLDDDLLVHMNWKLAAKAAGTEFRAFKKPEEFMAAANALSKVTRIFIDSDLGNGVKGEDIAKELHDKGFSDISMATGHGNEKFSHLRWLKVCGKEPPWEAK